MFSFFIASSDNSVGKTLTDIIESNRHSATVLGIAANGNGALGDVLALKPDILFVDVELDNIDGVTLVSMLYEEGWQGEVVFLSAMRDIDSVKNALKLSAVDYLFKPLIKEELTECIASCIARAERRKNISLLQKKAEDMHNLIEKRQIEITFGELLNDNFNEVQLREQEVNRLFKVHENTVFYLILVYSIEGKSQEIKNRLETEWVNCNVSLDTTLFIRENSKALYLLVGIDNLEFPPAKAYFTVDFIQKTIKDFMNVYVVSSGVLNDIKRLKNAHTNIMQELFFRNLNEISGTNPAKGASRLLYKDEFYRCLIKDCTEDELIKITADYLKSLCEEGELSINRVVISCLNLFFFLAEDLKPVARQEAVSEFIDSIYFITEKTTLFDINSCILTAITRFKGANSLYKRQSVLVDRLKSLIIENIAAVDVAFLADRLNISKNTLALRLKEISDLTVNEYIAIIKIEHIKRLLTETQRYVYEISFELGYKDVNYFSRFFRRYTGFTPTEFRERFGSNTP